MGKPRQLPNSSFINLIHKTYFETTIKERGRFSTFEWQ